MAGMIHEEHGEEEEEEGEGEGVSTPVARKRPLGLQIEL